jgi:hypothetical protein
MMTTGVLRERRSRLPLLLILLAVAVAVTGCASDRNGGPGVPPATTEAATDLVSCLIAQGWDVTANPDGSYLAAVPSDQMDRFQADEAECIEMFRFDEPVTQTQAETFFDALLDAAECVRELGYHVDDPPSRRFAVEEIQKPIIDLGWDPYEQPKFTASHEEMNEVYLTCPPPSLY